MGANQSDFEQVQLIPQSSPICATEPRFCLPTTVQLKLKEKFFSFSGDDFQICDPSGTPYFRCAGKTFSLRDKKTLLDGDGVPVLNIQEKLISFTDKFRVFAGADSDNELFKFNTEFNFIKAKLSAHVRNPINNSQHFVVLKGNWRDKMAIVFLGEPKQGGIPVAKIFRPLKTKSLFLGKDEYWIEIASGVDIALVVSMCIALDEHQRD